jgi:predicted permease
MLIHYLITAFRSFRKTAVYGLLNITGLALGIACAALIFLWVEDELSFDHAYPKHNELYSIRMNLDYAGKIESYAGAPEPMSNAIRETVPGIVNNSHVRRNRELFTANDKTTYEFGLYVDTGFFSMMHLPFAKGNAAGFNNPHTLVLSEKMAQKFFGATDPVGKTLQLNNQQSFVVIGVARNPPPNVSLQFDWLAPVSNFLEKEKWLNSWDTYGINTLVEVSPGADLKKINQQLTNLLRSKSQLPVSATCALWAMNDWHLRDNYTNGAPDGGQITAVRLFAAIAWIILLIACINFMNLATARADQRAREIGVRKTLGAVRTTLISQFLAETLVLSFLAVLLSVLFVYLALPYFNILFEKQLVFDPLSPAHLAGLLVIGTLCGLIAGSYPAFYLSAFNAVSVLKGQRTDTKSSAGFIRRGLVVTQFAISVALIVCTVIIYQQIRHIKTRDLGFNKQNLLYLGLPGKMVEHFDAIRTDLLQTGVVANAAITNSPPLEMWSTITFNDMTWEGSDPNSTIKAYWEGASPEFLSTMGLQLKEGRNFHAAIKSDSSHVIINESMARLMGRAGRVGSIIMSGKYKFEVIGIVKDHVFNNVYESASPLILSCDKRSPNNYHALYIRLQPGTNLSAALAKVEAVIKASNPGFPFEYQFADEKFDNLFRGETRVGELAGIFAALAILISCLGLFGLAAYTAERRTKEIGIRKLLGASAAGLAAMLAKEFMQLVALACLIAFPLAWGLMNNWLAQYAYRTAVHWWVFGVTGAVALLIALLTVSFQAIRSAMSNPVDSLRSE